jgi:transcriptional antiterminator RfaH
MQDKLEWYVVRTKARREAYAQDQLARRGVQTFLPRILEPGRSAAGPVVGPLFPGYLFARLWLSLHYTAVIWAPGVRSFVSFGEIPCALDSEVVDFIQERCGTEGIVRALPSFSDGDVVRVKCGPFGGLLGVVQGEVNARCRVRVLMDLLRRRTQVSLPVELLEHAGAA